MSERTGYTSISLKGLLAEVDTLSEEMGLDNRSETIRVILKRYFDLKKLKIDILRPDEKTIEKELNKF